MTSAPVRDQRLRDLARLRRVKDRIDREYAQPLDVESLARGAEVVQEPTDQPYGLRDCAVRGEHDPHPSAQLSRPRPSYP